MNLAPFDTAVLSWLARTSWQAAVLIALILLLQFAFRRQLPARWRYNLWLILLIRLALPIVPESPLSLFNLLRLSPPSTPPSQPALHLPSAPADTEPDPLPPADVLLITLPATSLEPPPDPLPITALPQTMASTATPPSSALSLPPSPRALPAPPRLRWQSLLLLIWLAGILILSLRIFLASRNLAAAVRRIEPCADPAILQIFRQAQRQMRIRRPIPILTTRHIATPGLVGFFRPRLLMPEDVLHHFERHELRLIFLHELAHVRRCDVAVNCLASALQVLHWFNPIVAFALQRLRADRELACDELVLSTAALEDRRLYGQTILKLLANLSRRTVLPGMIGILERSHPLRRRITMIAQFRQSPSRWSSLAIIAALLFSAAALTDAVRGQTGDEEQPRPAQKDRPTQPALLAEPAPAGEDAAGDTASRGVGRSSGAYGAGVGSFGRTESGAGQGTAGGIRGGIGGREGRTGTGGFGGGGFGRGGSGSADGGVGEADSDPFRSGRGIGSSARPAPGTGAADPYGQGVGQPVDRRAGAYAEAMAGYSRLLDPEAQQAAAETNALLRKRLPEVHFDSVPLSDVIEFFRDTTGANVFVDWRSLENAGFDPTTPVALRLKNVAFGDALRLALKSAGHGIGYNVEGGVIVISAADGPASDAVLKAYDVSHLVGSPAQRSGALLDHLLKRRAEAQVEKQVLEEQRGPEHPDVWRLQRMISALDEQIAEIRSGQTTTAAEPAPRGPSGLGGPMAPGAGGAAAHAFSAPAAPQNKMEELVRLIMESITPMDWIPHGGPYSVRPFNTKLIVNAPEQTHREIEKLLVMLSEKHAPRGVQRK